MFRVLIVEDQRTAQHVMETAIANSNQRFVLFYAIKNASMAEMYCMSNDVDLVLMDVFTAHRESGLDAAKKIKRKFPWIKVIITTSLPEVSFIQRAHSAGCDSFWYKDHGDQDLLDVMNRTMDGESVYPSHAPILKIGNALSTDFTARELDVLREKLSGYTNREICDHLGIKKGTLDYHMNNILSKTGYTNFIKLSVDIAEQKFIIPDF